MESGAGAHRTFWSLTKGRLMEAQRLRDGRAKWRAVEQHQGLSQGSWPAAPTAALSERDQHHGRTGRAATSTHRLSQVVPYPSAHTHMDPPPPS